MNVQVKGVKLSADVVDRLTDVLTGRLGSTGTYQVVPREQVKARLIEMKKGSYKECYAQSCQIELGQALAAQKTVATQVVKVGDVCTVTVNVFDLKREASEGGASVDGGCDEGGIGASLKAAVSQMVEKQTAARAAAAQPVQAVSAAPGGDARTQPARNPAGNESEKPMARQGADAPPPKDGLPGGDAGSQPHIPAIAVFAEVAAGDEDRRKELTAHLVDRIAATRRYEILTPATRLSCEANRRPQDCILEEARRMGAEKAIETRVAESGANCTVTMSVLDTRTGAVERRAMGRAPCSREGIVTAVDAALSQVMPK
jgi:hypothetical protein